MPMREIMVFQADIDAAKRIGEKMFPCLQIDDATVQATIETATLLGMEKLRVIWADAEAVPMKEETNGTR